MSRAGKITLPYAFCLFWAVLCVVLLMGGVAGWSVYRDAKASVAVRANGALEAAMAPANALLAGHFEPVAARVNDIRQWASAGVLRDVALAEWPQLLLPAFSGIPQVETVHVARGRETGWYFERSGDAWVGGMAGATSDVAGEWFAWGADGARISSEPMTARDAAVPDVGGAGSEARVTLAANFRPDTADGGRVAVTVDCVRVMKGIAALSGEGVRLRLDPGGRAAGQIQNAQTLALLQRRALPDSASTGLGVLFSDFPPDGTRWWYAADTYAIGDVAEGTWWVLAAVDEATLPPPALAVMRYLWQALAAGVIAALVLALLMGRKITVPLREVAARARSIQAPDEHYRPWPTSYFTEISALTLSLEELYESAVEHLDYHDAPLVVWAQPEEARDDAAIETEAVRHVMRVPRGQDVAAEAMEDGPVIDVRGGRDLARAVQIQAIQGTRREVRRLQGQLAGAYEELRTTAAHREQDALRLKRARACLRGLGTVLRDEGAMSATLLGEIRDVLTAGRVSLWVAAWDPATFRLRLHSDGSVPAACALSARFSFRALLQAESIITISDPRTDSRLDDLDATAFCSGPPVPKLLAPLSVAGQVLGFVLVEHLGSARRWKGDEELFLAGVAAQCAAVLWQQLRQRPSGNGNGAANGHGTANGNGTGVYVVKYDA